MAIPGNAVDKMMYIQQTFHVELLGGYDGRWTLTLEVLDGPQKDAMYRFVGKDITKLVTRAEQVAILHHESIADDS